MAEYNKYAAQADTIKIEDITSDKRNQSILQRLKDNDLEFTILSYTNGDINGHDSYEDCYLPDDEEDVGWLGYFIGSNTKLQELQFHQTPDNESFYIGMSSNTSINDVIFSDDSFFDQMFPLLGPFFKNNYNLNGISIEDCQLADDEEDARQLSLAIGKCNNSLKGFEFSSINAENSYYIITSLSMHPQLENIRLGGMNIGRNECSALATLLRCTSTNLRNLCLDNNLIDDTVVQILVQTLSNSNRLQKLDLLCNEEITIRGWKAVSSLLEISSSLEDLTIHSNIIKDEGALVFANALANNSTLKRLDLDYCGITPEGWKHFKKLICDTSSVNNTYLSNHTLQYLGDEHDLDSEDEHYEDRELDVNITDTLYYLEHNENENKHLVAMSKILKNHSHFNVESFFEWEFKVLPIVIRWFTKAATCKIGFEAKINKMKLSVVYDFIKEFPMLYIELSNQ